MKPNLKIDFALDVGIARRELGLTVKELADLIGVEAERLAIIEIYGASWRNKCFLPLCEELGLIPEDYIKIDDYAEFYRKKSKYDRCRG